MIEWVQDSLPSSGNRANVLHHLAGLPGARVIDVGGAMDAWADQYVDTYVDVLPIGNKRLYLGDINRQETWNPIEWEAANNGPWDFSICSHTLEDIRDPVFVIEKLQKISRAGYIAMPNKHTEVANIQSGAYKGYCHHRWVFSVIAGELVALSKFPILSSLDQSTFGWWDPSKVMCELGILWTKSIVSRYANDDFAGWKCEELAAQYSRELAGGI